MPPNESDDNQRHEAVVEPPAARQVWEKPQLTRLGMDAAENGGDIHLDGADFGS